MIKLEKLALVSAVITLALITPAIAQFRTDRPAFFREGFEQMQQEIQRLQSSQQTPQQALEHPSQLLTIEQGQLRWQKMIFRDGGFSVWMPEGIQSQETVNLTTNLGDIVFEVFASHPENLRYLAAYSQTLPGKGLNEAQKLLNSVRDGIISKTNYQLINDESISWENYSGQQLSLEKNGEMITFRLYLIGQRLYVLAASQENPGQIEQSVLNFFDSFRLLN